MQVAGGTNTAADCIAPSARKKRGPRDDKTGGAKQDVTTLGHNQEADRTTTKNLSKISKNLFLAAARVRDKLSQLIVRFPRGPGF
jgi:hypothetical protein